jgi:hypothetical protein
MSTKGDRRVLSYPALWGAWCAVWVAGWLAAHAQSLPLASRVQLSQFAALNLKGQTLVRWETALEAGVLYFDLLRESAGEWVKVNSAPILAVNAFPGGTYEVLDSDAPATGPGRYRLAVMLDTGGPEILEEQSLPITGVSDLALPEGFRVTSRVAARAPHLPDDFDPDAPEPPVAPGATSLSPAQPPTATTFGAPAAERWVKIRTRRLGIHFVSARSIGDALGQTEATVAGWISSGALAMSNKGLPVTYIPGTGSSGAGLFFYAEQNRNNYTDENVYWLKPGSNAFSTVDGGNPAPSDPNTYLAFSQQERDSFAITTSVFDPEADYYAWQGLTATTSSSAMWNAPTISLNRLVRGPDLAASLTLRVQGGSETPHFVAVEVNGTPVGEFSFTGRIPQTFVYSVPTTVLKDANLAEGNNQVTVKVRVAPGQSVSQVYVHGYRLEYPRSAYAASGFVEGNADGSTLFTARGFANGTLLVFDVSDVRAPKPVTKVRIDQPGTDFRAAFQCAPTGRYVVFQATSTSAAPAPAGLAAVQPGDLASPTNRASYVVITHPSLVASANKLAAYRAAKFRTKVVLLEDIYNEFSHGLVTPHALADFAKTAATTWSLPIRYLALLGDGTYDYRNLQGWGDNLVPPQMVSTQFGLFTTDSRYGETLGDGRMRLAVGRFCVTTDAQFDGILAKITAHESKALPEPLRALLIADRPDAAGDFVASITASEGYLSPRYTSEKVYPEPYPVGDNPPPIDVNAMRSSIQTALNDGRDWMNYVGHGAIDRFGKDGYLMVSHVAALANGARQPFVTAMTCVAGQYSSPGYNCLAETLVSATGRGAVGVIAPTGLSFDDDATWINRRVMEVVAKARSGRLGDVLMQTVSIYQQGAVRSTPIWIYNLVGDPALEVLVPAN